MCTRLFYLAQCGLVPSPALLQDRFPALCEDFKLPAFDTLEPVSEAAANSGKKRIYPEGFFGKDRTHFDTELPQSDGDAWMRVNIEESNFETLMTRPNPHTTRQLYRYPFVWLLDMAGPEEMPDVQSAGVKRPSVDLDSLQRKKFKAEELPLSAGQHAAIDHLLHAFKKKGGFDTVRKKLWAEFEDGEGKAEFTKLLVELAETEIEREPELLSRERGKAATLIEGAVDRSDVYKTVEESLDALASKHLPTILDSVREIRRQEIGDEAAIREEQAGNKTDEDYATHVKAKREERERAWQEQLRKQKEVEEEEARRKAEEERKQRELKRQKEEEERARRREREEQRRAEQRALDEQREKERQERYERRRMEERERFRDYDRYRDSDRSRTRDRDTDRERDRYRYRDRSSDHRSDRGLSPRHRDSRKGTSVTSKEATPALAPPPGPVPVPAPPVDEKSLEEAALQLLLKEGEELAAKARQKPEFDFEEAEAIENGLKPPPSRPKSTSDAKYSNQSMKAASPIVESGDYRRRGSATEDRPRTRRGDDTRSQSRRIYTSRFDDDRRDSRDTSDRPRDRDANDRLAIRDFREDRYGDRSYRPGRRSRSRSTTRGHDRDRERDPDRGRDERGAGTLIHAVTAVETVTGGTMSVEIAVETAIGIGEMGTVTATVTATIIVDDAAITHGPAPAPATEIGAEIEAEIEMTGTGTPIHPPGHLSHPDDDLDRAADRVPEGDLPALWTSTVTSRPPAIEADPPRRRVRSPERERDRDDRPRFGEVDRYIPGGERAGERDRKPEEPERSRDGDDRQVRRPSPSRRRSRSR
ncbi:BOD1/SHG1 domain-containing protein [Aspergillus tanneri]|uniref:BOD1/SHG1 domain-containing protein n=1 Tax=Aspergillus tanneri TaxID=1220188 RepID=A0A5M9MXT6_9EURO|nr:uncharacterized protein ATNIH1004_000794 [Aspergillus tanneri]KAA8651895.1 hypothetical protein ATNIH1004_000794 [Aspergillus tanneri]